MLKKRIPTIVGLFLLIIGAFGGVIFINEGTDFLPRASPEYAPQKVKISNLSDTGMVVSWITTEPAVGFVRYGNTASDLSITATDDRDQLAGSSGEYRTHYITLQNLQASSTYYFKLGSQKNQLYDNNGQAFAITTPASIDATPTEDVAYGTVVTAANTPADGSLVYITLDGATPISALVKQNGNWSAKISTARTTDLMRYAEYDPIDTELSIVVQPGSGEVAEAIVSTGNDKPVPTITLGQTHDFSTAKTQQSAKQVEAEVEAESAPVETRESKFASKDAAADSVDRTLTVTSIPKDGAIVDLSQPEIIGKAPANTTLTISVHSQNAYTDQIQSDASGKWSWTPPGNLEPGEHTLAVSYVDEEGILHKISRYFTVNAAESGQGIGVNALEYTATPSASSTPKPTATPKPTPRSTVATNSATLNAGSVGPSIYLIFMGLALLATGFIVIRKEE